MERRIFFYIVTLRVRRELYFFFRYLYQNCNESILRLNDVIFLVSDGLKELKNGKIPIHVYNIMYIYIYSLTNNTRIKLYTDGETINYRSTKFRKGKTKPYRERRTTTGKLSEITRKIFVVFKRTRGAACMI